MLKYTKNLAIMLLLMQSVVYSVINLYLPSLPAVAEYFSIEKVQVQFTISLYFLGLFVCAVLVNGIMARLGILTTMILGAIVFTLAAVFCIFSEDLLWLKISLFMIAVGAGPMAIMSRAMLGSIDPRERRGAMSTVYLSASLISSMIAPLIGGFISDFIWWQFVFVICALFGLLILYRIFIFKNDVKDYRPQIDDNLSSVSEIVSQKVFFLFFGIKWVLYVASQAFFIEIPFILHKHGFHLQEIGMIIVIVGTGFIFGSFLNTLFTKLLDVSRIIITALIVSLLGGAICAYQIFVFEVYIFLFGAWLLMIGMGMSASNLMLLVLNNFPQSLHSRISALYNTITLFMCFVITSIIGHIANYSNKVYYSMFLILTFFAVFLYIAAKNSGCFKAEAS